MITTLKYIAAAIGLASTTWLAMIGIAFLSNNLLVLYVALIYPWVAPVFAAVVVGIVALRNRRQGRAVA